MQKPASRTRNVENQSVNTVLTHFYNDFEFKKSFITRFSEQELGMNKRRCEIA